MSSAVASSRWAAIFFARSSTSRREIRTALPRSAESASKCAVASRHSCREATARPGSRSLQSHEVAPCTVQRPREVLDRAKSIASHLLEGRPPTTSWSAKAGCMSPVLPAKSASGCGTIWRPRPEGQVETSERGRAAACCAGELRLRQGPGRRSRSARTCSVVEVDTETGSGRDVASRGSATTVDASSDPMLVAGTSSRGIAQGAAPALAQVGPVRRRRQSGDLELDRLCDPGGL